MVAISAASPKPLFILYPFLELLMVETLAN